MAKSKFLRHARAVLMLGGMVFVNFSHAIQPLSEEAMGDVSFESGIEILNIYGSPSAGIEDEVEFRSSEPESNRDKEIETAKTSSEELIEDVENAQIEAPDVASIEENMTFEQIEAAIAESETTIGVASFNNTDSVSEIRYRDNDFQRGTEIFQDGSVQQTRELVIDRLSFENIRGDQQNPDRTVGSIYLSDWSSRGSTQITIE